MALYYFSLTNDKPFNDVDGLDLPDREAAREEAVGFALDVIRMEPGRRDWSRCAVRVTDGDGQLVLEIPFAEVA